MTRILLAVNDSPAGLAAARTALRFAQASKGQVLAVHVIADEPSRGGSAASPSAHPDRTARERISRDERAADALLAYIIELARESGVPIEARRLAGRPAQVILDEASRWGPDVIVLGRSGVRHVGQPFVGSQVLHVIEFTDVPVLVVPAA